MLDGAFVPFSAMPRDAKSPFVVATYITPGRAFTFCLSLVVRSFPHFIGPSYPIFFLRYLPLNLLLVQPPVTTSDSTS